VLKQGRFITANPSTLFLVIFIWTVNAPDLDLGIYFPKRRWSIPTFR